MKDTKSPELRKEIASIYAEMDKNPDAKPFGVRLISSLKSECEGRGVIPEAKLEKLRKVFYTTVKILGEDDE